MTVENSTPNKHIIIEAIILAKKERLEELKRSYKNEIERISSNFESMIELVKITPDKNLKKFDKPPISRFIKNITLNTNNSHLRDFTSKNRTALVLKKFKKMNALFSIYDIEREDPGLKRPTIRSLLKQLLDSERIYIKEKGRGQGSITIYGFTGQTNSKKLQDLEPSDDTLSSE